MQMRHLVLAVLGLVALVAATSVDGQAARGLGPDGVHLQATSDASGFVTAPTFVDLRLVVTPDDGDAAVWVSPSGRAKPSGTPVGRAVGSCVTAELVPAAAPGEYTCRVATTILQAGVTYYWWIVSHPGPGGEATVTGPFSFVLGTRAGERPSDATAAVAARLVTRTRFTGARSIKHAPLTSAIARTFRRIRHPRTLAVACWTDEDFTSVLAGAGIAGRSTRTLVFGVWLHAYPRWLHLSGRACRSIERLRRGGAPTGGDAFGLVVALHETAHAYGITSEAMANCYAVQLVPTLARALGIRATRSVYLGRLAIRYTRATAPDRYWDARRCRDGGAWDLEGLGTILTSSA